jgi:hypothetical protein
MFVSHAMSLRYAGGCLAVQTVAGNCVGHSNGELLGFALLLFKVLSVISSSSRLRVFELYTHSL